MGGVFTRRSYNYAAAGAASDPNFASTVLLLGFEGADASITFTDESSKLRGNASVFGNAQVDTADFKFGSASALFDGNNDLISFNDSNDFNLAAVAFCAECWIKPSSVAAGIGCIMGQWDAGTLGWYLGRNGSALQFHLSTTGANDITQMTGGTLSTSAWQHVAADFDLTKYRLFLDGVMVGSSTTLQTINNAAAVLGIGTWGNLGSDYAGWIDELRITRASRYGSDTSFTPPAAAFPRS